MNKQVILAIAISVIYNVLAEYLAHNPNTSANSPIQLLKQLFGFIKDSINNSGSGGGSPPAALT